MPNTQNQNKGGQRGGKNQRESQESRSGQGGGQKQGGQDRSDRNR
jgi:hypothetical protein